ncbi:uncharacterized protein YjgD (DUF1641 family) [Alicyclobacillus sacchari]|uniref:Uncharacterized protein YjgD (DUF1641 family) n=1 Tax=Alicyclobacillus sacchari TaxID=392010 RepID=A0A4R8LQF7_9BACL|nr:DUF1641 domain-containing protein [Alicyclobacillus sacchari]TDY49724.1 uncharacterized protein YjgD (DUF1641 family) [Alicyclobacillus sacchari]GMA58351.1 hypothetical protein GCM10025858_28540 [Alicyclobacillus sacchari]
MGEPITSIQRTQPDPLQSRAASLERVAAHLAADEEGVIAGLRLLGALEEKGLLPLLTALVERGDRVLARGVDVLHTSSGISALQTAVTLLQWVGKLDSNSVSTLFTALDAGVKRAGLKSEEVNRRAQGNSRPIGIYDILAKLQDPSVNTAIGYLFEFLAGMGEALREAGLPK